MKKFICAATCLILASALAQAADQPVSANSATTTLNRSTPDNTNINKRDRNEQTITPLDQSNTDADMKITQAIRKTIMSQQFSMNAKNIKIITQNGEVTLRGPVDSSAEIERINSIANGVPGTKSVDNQLEVK
jgi:hyperosmotically inducible protein